MFSVPDFIGYACNQIASRIRQAVAQITFDEFHRRSAAVIHYAVMGNNDTLRFPANNLVSVLSLVVMLAGKYIVGGYVGWL